MSTQLGYSMFQDVLFPTMDQSAVSTDDQILKLRRVKRFMPEWDFKLKDATLVVFDLETTGLDSGVDRIIEVGAVKLRNLVPIAEFSTLVRTDIEVTEDIIRLTGITSEMLEGQPVIDDVLVQFLEFIEGGILVAHNAEFDLSMLQAACALVGIDLDWPCFC